MIVDFGDLKALVEADLDSTLSESLAARIPQYQDVIPEEILDLLEEAAETYTTLAATLPHHLRKTAREEIEFLISLYEDKIRDSLHIKNPQPPQKILQILSSCGT